MPIYEYTCEKCGHEFEREQRISDPPVRSCPVCRARKVRKLISRTSFVLKGGGWYKDLYATPKAGAEGEKKKEAPAADGKGDKKDKGSKEKAEPPKKSGGSDKSGGSGKTGTQAAA